MFFHLEKQKKEFKCFTHLQTRQRTSFPLILHTWHACTLSSNSQTLRMCKKNKTMFNETNMSHIVRLPKSSLFEHPDQFIVLWNYSPLFGWLTWSMQNHRLVSKGVSVSTLTHVSYITRVTPETHNCRPITAKLLFHMLFFVLMRMSPWFSASACH